MICVAISMGKDREISETDKTQTNYILQLFLWDLDGDGGILKCILYIQYGGYVKLCTDPEA